APRTSPLVFLSHSKTETSHYCVVTCVANPVVPVAVAGFGVRRCRYRNRPPVQRRAGGALPGAACRTALPQVPKPEPGGLRLPHRRRPAGTGEGVAGGGQKRR